MDHQPLFVAAALATDQAERLYAPVSKTTPPSYQRIFSTTSRPLVTQLRDLRDAIHDAGLDPHPPLSPRRQRAESERLPVRLQDVPLDRDEL